MPTNILFLRDPALHRLMKPAARALRDLGHGVRFAKRKLRWGTPERNVAPVRDSDLSWATVIVAGPGSPVTRQMLDAAPNLTGLVAPAAGCDAFDVDLATERGLVVAHGATPEQYDSMAEGTIAMMLALQYRLTWAERSLRAGWQAGTPRLGWMLQGKTVGLLGYGPIAQGVARRLAPWGVKLQAWSRSKTAGRVEDGVAFCSLDALIAEADILSLHLRQVPETEGLLDKERLRSMKRGAVIVNTGRGALIDEAAMAEALGSGSLGGAALDAFALEPLSMDSPLRRLDNVLLTPHNVGHTDELWQSVQEALVENLNRIASHRKPLITKNPEVLDQWLRRAKG